jgi:hypothetical protein
MCMAWSIAALAIWSWMLQRRSVTPSHPVERLHATLTSADPLSIVEGKGGERVFESAEHGQLLARVVTFRGNLVGIMFIGALLQCYCVSRTQPAAPRLPGTGSQRRKGDLPKWAATA